MTSINERFFALDVLRGLAIFLMIVVDAPPDKIYKIFQHANWAGLTLADLAFPMFVFAMGMSAAISSSRRLITWRKIFVRAGSLFLIGVLLNALTVTDLENFRVFGVLQRLALTYALGMTITKFVASDWGLCAWALTLLIASSAGFHLYATDNPFDEAHNLSGTIDLIFPGANHIYTPTHDPEGLFGTINSTASMLIGFVAGKWRDKFLWLIIFGIALLLMGGAWSFSDIIAKKIWTTPFALLTAGINLILLTMIMLMSKVKKIFKPVVSLGKNPLIFFVASNVAVILLSRAGIWEKIFWQTRLEFISLELNVLIFCLIWAGLWTILAGILDRRGIVIKL